jgi:hypothetical protein
MDLRTTRTIRSTIEIRAPLDATWQVLTDFAAYPEWNPHVRRIRGRPQRGARIAIESHPPGGHAIVMHPLIVTWDPPHELRWQGTFLAGRLFTGEHGFRLDELAPDRLRFTQDENFSGLLVPAYAWLRLARTRQGFEQMNEALRERAESLGRASG